MSATIIGKVPEHTKELIKKHNARIQLILSEFGSLKAFQTYLRVEGQTEERWFSENCISTDFLENVLESLIRPLHR
jgi:hypothetical protein